MRLLNVASFCLALLAAPAVAQTPLTTSLHFAFAKVGGPAMRFVDCSGTPGGCRYDLDRGGRIMARGDGAGTAIEELSGYFSPDRPGGAQAVVFLEKSMAVFSPREAERARKAAIAEIVNEAAERRRAERTLGGVRYVLRASDGNDVRVYVTMP